MPMSIIASVSAVVYGVSLVNDSWRQVLKDVFWLAFRIFEKDAIWYS